MDIGSEAGGVASLIAPILKYLGRGILLGLEILALPHNPERRR
ncbi:MULTISPECIES: hypothetical protein [unclassified Rhizobium]|nr:MULTISPECIES: hypothetical protein [unclassified Rhizobium]